MVTGGCPLVLACGVGGRVLPRRRSLYGALVRICVFGSAFEVGLSSTSGFWGGVGVCGCRCVVAGCWCGAGVWMSLWVIVWAGFGNAPVYAVFSSPMLKLLRVSAVTAFVLNACICDARFCRVGVVNAAW